MAGCCENCFGNRGIGKEIAFRSTTRGKCHYCKSPDMALLEPTELGDKFRTLLDAYEPNDGGKLLVAWLKEDWDLFPGLDEAHTKELLGDILNDGELPRKPFAPLAQPEPAPADRWEQLREELMHHNRFFPQVQIDLDSLEQLLTALRLDTGEFPTTWYRARTQTEDEIFPIEKMGAPPAKTAGHGRANPAGIPYLYMASDKATAVSELRPHTGEKVCLASFEAPADLSLVDLRDPRRTVSPFSLADLLADDTTPAQMRREIAFLQRLGKELTQPVLPTVAAFEYTPSQYLCEFIKKCGYDGVVYRSAMGDGMNLALFKPENARGVGVEPILVTRVHVELAS